MNHFVVGPLDKGSPCYALQSLMILGGLPELDYTQIVFVGMMIKCHWLEEDFIDPIVGNAAHQSQSYCLLSYDCQKPVVYRCLDLAGTRPLVLAAAEQKSPETSSLSRVSKYESFWVLDSPRIDEVL